MPPTRSSRRAGRPRAAVGPPGAVFTVDGEVALASFMALGDGHLLEIADHFRMLAATEAARAADWRRIRGPLGASERLAAGALLWFALPDGSYWSVQEGQAAANLSDRPYWPRLMAGRNVIGDLVVSRATGRSTAIVAVPVRGRDGSVVGALGASVYLDSLSLRIEREMDLPDDVVFFSIDATPIGALQHDPSEIFTNPLELGEDLARAIREMLAHESGVVSYTYEGARRTLLYRRSHVSGWWYALGVVDDGQGGTP